jgi:hypothetical protein
MLKGSLVPFFSHHNSGTASKHKTNICTVYYISLEAVSSPLMETILEKKYARNIEKHEILLNYSFGVLILLKY